MVFAPEDAGAGFLRGGAERAAAESQNEPPGWTATTGTRAVTGIPVTSSEHSGSYRDGSQLRILQVQHRVVAYRRCGAGPPVLLLHGLGSNSAEMIAAFRCLRHRYEFIGVDRPGYGQSEANDMRAEDQAEWLSAFIRTIGIRRPIVVAHSIAALVAISFALRFATAGLVLIAPYCRPTRPAPMLLLRTLSHPVLGPLITAGAPAQLRRRLARNRLQAACAPDGLPRSLRDCDLISFTQGAAFAAAATELKSFNEAAMRHCFAMRQLQVPVAIVVGACDPIAAPARHARWMASRVPHARLCEAPHRGHMVHHWEPALVDRCLRDADRAIA